jgi:hypothetical protein
MNFSGTVITTISFVGNNMVHLPIIVAFILGYRNRDLFHYEEEDMKVCPLSYATLINTPRMAVRPIHEV